MTRSFRNFHSQHKQTKNICTYNFMKQSINGSNLMIFYGNESLALATNHTINFTVNVNEAVTKDSGIWSNAVATSIAWECTSDNLAVAVDYNRLYDKMVARQPVELVFGMPSDWTENGLTDGTDYWSDPSSPTGQANDVIYYKGKAIITSLNLSAPAGDNATYSITFKGVGAITKAAN